MHHLHSPSSVIRYRLASLVLLVLLVLSPVTLAIVCYILLSSDGRFAATALQLLGGVMGVMIIHGVSSARARCPICHGKTMWIANCSKHRSAKRLLGSYRLQVAAGVIFTNSFNCPYCGELTAIKARSGPRVRSH